jgi:hypothetical protein
VTHPLIAAADLEYTKAMQEAHTAEKASGEAQNVFRVKPNLQTYNEVIASGARWLARLEVAEQLKEKLMNAIQAAKKDPQ